MPIPLSVVDGTLAADTGAFNVNRLKELIPTVQFYSTNPRNSAINIRGLGAPFGLTNDGLEPGVGLYIDGVFYSRPASATLDFLDVDRIEVLRGPQGTLFGKNTTAGAINVTTRKTELHARRRTSSSMSAISDSFRRRRRQQARSAGRSPAGCRSPARSATARSTTSRPMTDVNNLNNLGLRGQLLFAPSDNFAITGVGGPHASTSGGLHAGGRRCRADAAPAEPAVPADCRGPWLHALRASTRSTAVTDVDTPLRSYQDLGGASVNVDWKLRTGQVTSTTAWRYWNWNPSSDRDFIGLPVTTISAAPSKQRQWTQEVRYAGDALDARESRRRERSRSTRPSIPIRRSSRNRARPRRDSCCAPSANAATPGLLDGYGYNQYVDYGNTSAAVFGQVAVAVTDRLRLLPGVRFNYDHKDVDFDQQVYGGLQTTDPALIALQLSILAPQAYKANVERHESVRSADAGVQSGPERQRVRDLRDRIQVRRPQSERRADGRVEPAGSRGRDGEAGRHPQRRSRTEDGAVRGVTANITRLRHRDQELPDTGHQRQRGRDSRIPGQCREGHAFAAPSSMAAARVGSHSSIYAAAAYTDGKYVTFKDAPPPLEDTGGPQFEDISGSMLPGISKWALSLGGEYAQARDGLRPVGEPSSAPSTAATDRRSRRAPHTPGIWSSMDTPAERPPRFPGSGWLDDLVVVPQPSEPGLLRAAHRGAGEHRPLRRAARRSTDNRRDVEGSVEGAQLEFRIQNQNSGARRHHLRAPARAGAMRKSILNSEFSILNSDCDRLFHRVDGRAQAIVPASLTRC